MICEWRYRDDPTDDWTDWDTPDENVNTYDKDSVILNTPTPRQYQYRAGNGSCDDPKRSRVVSIVKVYNDVTFSPDALCADGSSTATASATIAPSNRTITWSIQGSSLGCTINSSTGVITAGTTGGTITIRAADSELPGCYPVPEAELHVLSLDLDIDGILDTDETSVGGLVVREFDNNNAERKKIILRPVYPISWTGNVILSRNNTKVKVFDASSGGTEITFNGTDNKFANSSLPEWLWVEGNSASGSMRDVVLDLVPFLKS